MPYTWISCLHICPSNVAHARKSKGWKRVLPLKYVFKFKRNKYGLQPLLMWWSINLLVKVHLSINDTSNKIKVVALLARENITFGIDSVWNFSLEVKENDELIIWISRHYCVDSCSVALTSFRHSKQKENGKYNISFGFQVKLNLGS